MASVKFLIVMLNGIMESVTRLIAILLSVARLNVILLSVVAPALAHLKNVRIALKSLPRTNALAYLQIFLDKVV